MIPPPIEKTIFEVVALSLGYFPQKLNPGRFQCGRGFSFCHETAGCFVRNSGESHVDHAMTKAPAFFDWGFLFVPNDAPTPRFFGAAGLSQQEVLEDELAFRTRQRRFARPTRYLAVNSLWSGFHFDQLIERIAVWARKRMTPPASRHVGSSLLDCRPQPSSRSCHKRLLSGQSGTVSKTVKFQLMP